MNGEVGGGVEEGVEREKLGWEGRVRKLRIKTRGVISSALRERYHSRVNY